jgi:hypothetical protein
MNVKQVTVTDFTGKEVPAELIICPECGGEAFHLYVIADKHNHMQCTSCDRCFCQGGCEKVNPS